MVPPICLLSIIVEAGSTSCRGQQGHPEGPPGLLPCWMRLGVVEKVLHRWMRRDERTETLTARGDELLTVGSGTELRSRVRYSRLSFIIHLSYQGAAASVQKQFALQLQELLAPTAKGAGPGKETFHLRQLPCHSLRNMGRARESFLCSGWVRAKLHDRVDHSATQEA